MVLPRIPVLPRAAAPAEAQSELTARLDALLNEFEAPSEFSPEALADAERAIAAHAAGQGAPSVDLRDVPFVTVDPASSTDLDQAVFLARAGAGYLVRYAIADVPSFVEPGSALDAETRERGQTIYLPHRRIGLHPGAISEDAGSLLPNVDRWAYVFTFELGEDAGVSRMEVERAVIRSTAKLSYEGVQADLDSGSPSEFASLLREVGEKRIELERQRGGASLNLPEQEVEIAESGRIVLTSRAPLPVETFNAQISLMTGLETGRLFVEHGVGLLRTMPAPGREALAEFRARVKALGTPWPEGVPYGEFLRSLDTSDPHQLAAMYAAGSLFRGAGYLALPSGEDDDGAALIQAALGAPYAHTTAPLRRLVDRFALVVVEALSASRPVPPEVLDALPQLPALMKASDQRAGQVQRAALDLVEAFVLSSRVGEVFSAEVTSSSKGKAAIQIADPAVSARVSTDATPGSQVRVRLAGVDLDARTLSFEVVGPQETQQTS
ncbi:RNB domain-containing ribonuclease [Falsarthrobacter nasiphocae]|nr:RNB domain-containing ribonuclease [Falsarthrobacter nasiphocae]